MSDASSNQAGSSIEFTVRDEANALVACVFLNGPLETLNARQYSELLGNAQLSRITDVEMKTLMINACETLAELLQLREDHPEAYRQKLVAYSSMYCSNWNR